MCKILVEEDKHQLSINITRSMINYSLLGAYRRFIYHQICPQSSSSEDIWGGGGKQLKVRGTCQSVSQFVEGGFV